MHKRCFHGKDYVILIYKMYLKGSSMHRKYEVERYFKMSGYLSLLNASDQTTQFVSYFNFQEVYHQFVITGQSKRFLTMGICVERSFKRCERRKFSYCNDVVVAPISCFLMRWRHFQFKTFEKTLFIKNISVAA